MRFDGAGRGDVLDASVSISVHIPRRRECYAPHRRRPNRVPLLDKIIQMPHVLVVLWPQCYMALHNLSAPHPTKHKERSTYGPMFIDMLADELHRAKSDSLMGVGAKTDNGDCLFGKVLSALLPPLVASVNYVGQVSLKLNWP